MQLDPLKWSVRTLRLYALIVTVIAVGAFLLLQVLGLGWQDTHKTATFIIATIAFFAVCSFVWIAAASKYGYRSGLLYVVILVVSLFFVALGARWVGLW